MMGQIFNVAINDPGLPVRAVQITLNAMLWDSCQASHKLPIKPSASLTEENSVCPPAAKGLGMEHCHWGWVRSEKLWFGGHLQFCAAGFSFLMKYRRKTLMRRPVRQSRLVSGGAAAQSKPQTICLWRKSRHVHPIRSRTATDARAGAQ
jgi:hypothetical protein